MAAALPAVGDTAPGFLLPDHTGTPRSLADARGRWLVLFFYPKDDTPGCTVESCGFRDIYDEIRAAGADVWGVSILDSASKAAFRDKFQLPFTLLADADHAVSERYGVWVEKRSYGRSSWGVRRATLLLDPQGRVARSWPAVTPSSHAAEVLEALESLGAARQVS
jgi:peroxiredoxin Q/BCP